MRIYSDRLGEKIDFIDEVLIISFSKSCLTTDIYNKNWLANDEATLTIAMLKKKLIRQCREKESIV